MRRKKIELPEDLQDFAEERVREGQSASVDDVVKEAAGGEKRAVLREALDASFRDQQPAESRRTPT
jgi:Arc/MetJ-type ribon-helix-helix transcriptional regulator